MKIFRNLLIILDILLTVFIGLSVFFYVDREPTARNERVVLDTTPLKDSFVGNYNPVDSEEYNINGIGYIFDDALEEAFCPIEDIFMDIQKNYSSDEISGVWYCYYDIGDQLAEEIGFTNKKLYFPVKIVFDFSEDGSLHAYADIDSVNDGIDTFVNNSMDAIYEFVASYGISQTQANILVSLTYGGDWGKFIKDYFGPLIQEEVSESQIWLHYKAVNGKLYLWPVNGNINPNNYCSYEIGANSLTCEGDISFATTMCELPLVLQREE